MVVATLVAGIQILIGAVALACWFVRLKTIDHERDRSQRIAVSRLAVLAPLASEYDEGFDAK